MDLVAYECCGMVWQLKVNSSNWQFLPFLLYFNRYCTFAKEIWWGQEENCWNEVGKKISTVLNFSLKYCLWMIYFNQWNWTFLSIFGLLVAICFSYLYPLQRPLNFVAMYRLKEIQICAGSNHLSIKWMLTLWPISEHACFRESGVLQFLTNKLYTLLNEIKLSYDFHIIVPFQCFFIAFLSVCGENFFYWK